MTVLTKKQIDYLKSGRFSPHAIAWLVHNLECLPPELGGDPVKNALMLVGHFRAISSGVRIDSRRYYEIIESWILEHSNV